MSVLDLGAAATMYDLELEDIGHTESGRFRFDKAPKITGIRIPVWDRGRFKSPSPI
jgi:hypothetical protein